VKRPVATRTGLVLLGGVLLLASGCRSLANCSKPGAYDSAVELPPLRMPVGLDGPDTRQAMMIPALNEPEVPLAAGQRCLEEPPPITGPRTVTPPGTKLAPAADRAKGKRTPPGPPRG
jgi:hypothetical protein